MIWKTILAALIEILKIILNSLGSDHPQCRERLREAIDKLSSCK